MGLSALGLNQWFLRQVDETLEPGRAALFVVVSGGADHERAIEALQPLAPRMLRTNLDSAAEQRLLAAFTEAAPQASSKSPSRQLRSDRPRMLPGVEQPQLAVLAGFDVVGDAGGPRPEGFTHLTVVLRR